MNGNKRRWSSRRLARPAPSDRLSKNLHALTWLPYLLSSRRCQPDRGGQMVCPVNHRLRLQQSPAAPSDITREHTPHRGPRQLPTGHSSHHCTVEDLAPPWIYSMIIWCRNLLYSTACTWYPGVSATGTSRLGIVLIEENCRSKDLTGKSETAGKRSPRASRERRGEGQLAAMVAGVLHTRVGDCREPTADGRARHSGQTVLYRMAFPHSIRLTLGT